jgi:voltage-gated potassium channel Kch
MHADFSRVTHRDNELRPDAQDFVLVCGYGRVGKMVCEMLDQNLVRYVAIDKRPNKALDARTKGLPVFVGDISRSEVLSSFDASSAKACVIALTDVVSTNKAVVALRKLSPTVPIIVRARDSQHQKRLESMFGK